VDDSSDAFYKWETEIYPKIWREAYDLGVAAFKAGLPRVCNLGESFRTPSGSILKVYKSAWEQGWDGYSIPGIFGQMEAVLKDMPLRPLEE
jgi:hypothetical protein